MSSDADLEPEAPAGHTAVVYFHGIGSPRRYAEISRVVEALDRYAYSHYRRVGRLARTRVGLEPSRTGTREPVAFIELVHRQRIASSYVETPFRFYEGYWAPVTAGRVGPREVAAWMIRHVLNPLRPLLAPWRSHARVRRAALFRLAAVDGKRSLGRKVRKSLLRTYYDFEGLEARREYSDGSFGNFLKLLRKKSPIRVPPARQWHRYHVRSLLLGQFVILSLALTLVIGALALVTGVAVALEWAATGLSEADGIISSLDASAANIGLFAGALLGILGVTRFFRDHVGDVLLWATYTETEEKFRTRKEILESGLDVLEHVIADPACSRVVVIGHSLGTSIAYDCLLALGNRRRAQHGGRTLSDLSAKLDQFVTMGSPIDTIHTTFESHRGLYHRYVRVFEDVRGDVGEAPFLHVGGSGMHWVNFWDRADVVGGPLFTPNEKEGGGTPVDNYEVSSYRFPSPARSHSGYFEHEELLGHLFDMIIFGKYSFRSGDRSAGQRLGTAPPYRRVLSMQTLMLTLPWLLTATFVSRLADAEVLELFTWVVLLASVSILGGAWLAAWGMGHRCSIWATSPDSSEGKPDSGLD